MTVHMLKGVTLFFISFPVWANDFDNPLDLNNVIGRVGNTDELDIYGFEGEISYRPKQKDFVRFDFNISHAEGKSLDTIYSDNVVVFEGLSKTVPNNSFGLLISRNVFDIQWSLGVVHVAEAEWHPANRIWRADGDLVDSYTRFDVSLSKKIPLNKDKNLMPKLGAQNLGSRRYSEFPIGIEIEPYYFATIALASR